MCQFVRSTAYCLLGMNGAPVYSLAIYTARISEIEKEQYFKKLQEPVRTLTKQDCNFEVHIKLTALVYSINKLAKKLNCIIFPKK